MKGIFLKIKQISDVFGSELSELNMQCFFELKDSNYRLETSPNLRVEKSDKREPKDCVIQTDEETIKLILENKLSAQQAFTDSKIVFIEATTQQALSLNVVFDYLKKAYC